MKRTAFAALIMALIPALAVAATKQKVQTLTVRGSVLQNCLVSVGSVTFPNAGIGYIHNSGNVVLTQSSLGMRCTKGAVAQISMNTGLYGSKAGTQFGSRSMKSTQGKNYLGYDLCHDSACASVWSPAAYTYTSATDKGSSLPVWGRIKTGQQADSGTYADSVTVTVSF